MTNKLQVVVLFGGRSAEHEVSIQSARSVLAALDPRRYEALPIAITPQGRWLPVERSRQLLTHARAFETAPEMGPEAGSDGARSTLVTTSSRAALVPIQNQLPEATTGLRSADIVIPLIHGTYGEDGTLQGVLEFAGVPYVGAGVAGSAVGMDKHLMKLVLRAAGLPVLDWLLVERHRWRAAPAEIRRQVADCVRFPCFVKPANMGSSVGVHKVHAAGELHAALDDASKYDVRILVERAACAPREIECSVLGNHEPVASVPGEIKPGREFYDYRAKYVEDSSELLIPAPLAPDQIRGVQELAIKAFRALDCAGMARVDFLLEGDTLWLSELNTIPGFTRISMYPKLWEASGLSYSELLDRLIALAIERHAERRTLITQYDPSSERA